MTTANILSQLGSPGVSTGFKNRIINGAMMIDQRNSGASVTNAANTTTYCLDRWNFYGTSASKFSVQQSTTVPSGFKNSLVVTSLSANSPASTDEYKITQPIEGLNLADLGWGTASASTVTLSFWVRSSLTGTFGGAINNSAGNRNYPFSYTISVANTWEQKSITIAGDTSGTWLTTNGVGLYLAFNLGTGTTYLQTAGSWTASYADGATGSTNILGTNGATFYITGVQLEKGSTATSFDYRPYGTELALCQRYYETQYFRTSLYGNGANTIITTVPMKVSKRATPSITLGSDPEGWTSNFPTAAGNAYNSDSIAVYTATGVASAGLSRFGSILAISAEL